VQGGKPGRVPVPGRAEQRDSGNTPRAPLTGRTVERIWRPEG